MSIRSSLALSILLFYVLPLSAQDVQFSCGVDRTEVPLGQRFQVTYTLSGGSLKQYKDFRAPDLNRHFMTLAGPSTSQQMQIINGRVSTKISWTYVLQPRNTGTYTVPAARITYDGTMMTSNTVSIKVTSAVPGSGSQQQKNEEEPDVDLGDNLYVQAIPNRTDVFVGEPITVTYKLFSRVAFQLENPIKLPRMKGFWSEDVEAPTQLRPRIEVHKGRQYETYMLRKVIYFPTQSGELSIDPLEIGAVVRVRKRRRSGDDAFDRFFSDPFMDSFDNVRKTLATRKIDVNVRPLPEEGKPQGFSGVVGFYEMRASLDRNELKANETATLSITLTGKGNIRLLDEPTVIFPSGMDSYSPTINEDARPEGGTLVGSKSFEYLLVPRFAGKVTIPPVTFSYFDPAKASYVKLESEAFSLDISEGDERRTADAMTRTSIDYLAMDVRGIRDEEPQLQRGVTHGVHPVTMLLSYLIPAIALALALLWKRRYDQLRGDVAGMRRRRATRVAEKRLSASRKFLDAGKIDAYYQEIAHALWGYVQDKLGMPTSIMTIDSVIEHLQAANLDTELIERMRQGLDAVEYARFSPTRSSTEEMRSLYARTEEVIILTEQAMRERT
ncbi:MAG: protein BatD [Bacteroidetes bacterium]|nr:protein BatD [Bacteroidota bacterium]